MKLTINESGAILDGKAIPNCTQVDLESNATPFGDRIIIDRKTGRVFQLERISAEGMEKACQVIAKALVDNLLAEQRKEVVPQWP